MSGPLRGSETVDRLAHQAVDTLDREARTRAGHAPLVATLEKRVRNRRLGRRAGMTSMAVALLAVAVAMPRLVGPSVVIDSAAPDTGTGAEEDRGAAEASLRWSRPQLGAGGVSASGSFVVANDEAVFTVGGGGYGYVNAARLDDGAEVWRVQVDAGGGVHVQLATDDLVVVNPQYEELLALAAEDGQRVWTFSAPEDYGFVSSTREGDLLVAIAGTPVEQDIRPPLVFGLDLATGEQRWVATLREGDSPQCMSPVVAGGTVVVYTMPDVEQQRSAVHAVDIASGTHQWTTEVGESRDLAPCMEGGLLATEGHVHVPLPGSTPFGDGSVTLDLTDGEQRWMSGARPIAASGPDLVMRDHRRLFTVAAATGDTLVEGDLLALADGDLSRAIDTDGPVVTLAGDRLFFVDPATATVAGVVDLPAPANEVIVTGDVVILGSEDLGVFVLELDLP